VSFYTFPTADIQITKF